MNAKARLGWIRLYEQNGNAALVCRRCGISASTLRKWVRSYQAEGLAGLEDRSRRPRTSPQRLVFAEQEQLILERRRARQLGIKRLRNELLRLHSLKLALGTIHAVLVRHRENHLRRPRLQRKGSKRYSRPVPGERVQMDVCKIANNLYQYTAVDDCTRYRVLGLGADKTAASTLRFLNQILAALPFPIQRAGDLYEVCEQAQKSVKWTWSLNTLVKHRVKRETEHRRGRPTRFIRGTAGELVTPRTGARRKLVTFRIGIVQPGLSRRNAPADHLAIVGATNSIIQTVTDHPLLVCGSP